MPGTDPTDTAVVAAPRLKTHVEAVEAATAFAASVALAPLTATAAAPTS